jgi:hypothetical protein
LGADTNLLRQSRRAPWLTALLLLLPPPSQRERGTHISTSAAFARARQPPVMLHRCWRALVRVASLDIHALPWIVNSLLVRCLFLVYRAISPVNSSPFTLFHITKTEYPTVSSTVNKLRAKDRHCSIYCQLALPSGVWISINRINVHIADIRQRTIQLGFGTRSRG